MTKCLGGCGREIDGMCVDCVEGARILNRNAIARLTDEVRVVTAERVVEAQDGLISDLRKFGPERIPESRWDDVDAAVAEYRKAGGK